MRKFIPRTQHSPPLVNPKVIHSAINILAVGAFGEAEFWLSGGKVILIFSLFFFTFITMVGGNPAHDVYGFRNWTNGGAFREYITSGSLGRFEGFLGGLTTAVFAVVGPEYISIVAAEAMRPRVYIKSAFKMVYLRFGLFFIGGALAVGIVVSSRDPTLKDVVVNGKGAGAAASPYVIAMTNLGISVFPDIINASVNPFTFEYTTDVHSLILTSIFSAGNTYTYVSVRNLYSLSLEGRAPRFLSHCTRKGVPIYAFCVVMIFPLLAFTAVSSGSAVAIDWFASLVTGGGLINYVTMSFTYIRFYNHCKVQGLDRNTLPYKGWFQPYCAYFAFVWMFIVASIYGYTCYLPSFDVSSFFANYTMQLFIPPLFIIWKVSLQSSHPLRCGASWLTPISSLCTGPNLSSRPRPTSSGRSQSWMPTKRRSWIHRLDSGARWVISSALETRKTKVPTDELVSYRRTWLKHDRPCTGSSARHESNCVLEIQRIFFLRSDACKST